MPVSAYSTNREENADIPPGNIRSDDFKRDQQIINSIRQLMVDLANFSAGLGTTFQPADADLTSWAAITRAAGFDTFTATPTSANLATLLTDETGTGAAVFASSPALIGNPTAPTPTAGDNDTSIATTAFVTTAVANAAPAIVFTQAFESTQQTITSAGALTIAHGLGVQPKLYNVVLQCLTAEHGYSIGDEVMVIQTRDTADSRGISMVPNSTNINIRFGSFATVFPGVNKTTGAGVVFTNANWALVARAWA